MENKILSVGDKVILKNTEGLCDEPQEGRTELLGVEVTVEAPGSAAGALQRPVSWNRCRSSSCRVWERCRSLQWLLQQQKQGPGALCAPRTFMVPDAAVAASGSV